MHEFELKTEPDEMEPEDLRATLTDFMEKHDENVDEYRELESDFSETKDALEDAEDTLDTLKTKFAEEAADYINLDPHIIAERFTYSEIVQIVEEGDEADFSEDEQTDDEPDTLTTFTEREEKGNLEGEGGAGGNERTDFSDAAREKLHQHF